MVERGKLKEGETLEYWECPGGIREPVIVKTDLVRRMLASRNKAVLAHGWLDATQDEINDALTTGGPNGDGIYGLKWLH
jgi:hypothetical protein